MKEIELSQGKVSLVDDDMFEFLSQWKWCAFSDGKTWYAHRGTLGIIPRTTIRMHREIINAPSGFRVDHKDRDGLHNWRENLRLCTHAQNATNRGPTNKNKSGYKGVTWLPESKNWRSTIAVNGRLIHLGCFYDIIEAAKVRDEASKIYHGEFAFLNFPGD